MAALRSSVKFRTRVTVRFVRPGRRGLPASGCRLSRIGAAHGPRAFTFAGGADVGFSLALLLRRLALSLLSFGVAKVTLVAAFAFVFRGAGLFQGNRDRLPPALHRAAFAAATAF